MSCMSNHRHSAAWAARICDANLMVRVANDRAARPAQYQPIPEPTLSPAPSWLNRAGKDLTGDVRSN